MVLQPFCERRSEFTMRVCKIMDREKPRLFISGHSHIVKAMRDPKPGLLHLNPGAIGIEGLHKVRTLMTFKVEGGKIKNLNLVELGKRGRLAD